MARDIDSNRPGIGETILAAGGMAHSFPALLVSWLALALAGSGLVHIVSHSGVPPLLQIPFSAVLGLVLIFFHAGYMGSFDLILRLGGWSPISIIECGRHYFRRFFLLGLMQGLLLIVLPASLGVLVALAMVRIHLVFFLLLIPVALGVAALVFLMIFSQAGVVVEEKQVFEAISYSFRVVRANFLPTLVLILVFSGIPSLFSFLIDRLYGEGLEFPRLFFTTLVSAYGHLLLLAALVYFAVEIGKPPEREI